jgi:uncharacterized protein YpiB (UPF0302 family)
MDGEKLVNGLKLKNNCIFYQQIHFETAIQLDSFVCDW